MRKIITMVFLLFSVVAFSQQIEIGETVKVNDGTQRGTLVYNGVKFVQNGIWKSDYAKAEYDMGKLLWIHPKGNRRWTSEQLTILRLKNKVEALETAIASNTK